MLHGCERVVAILGLVVAWLTCVGSAAAQDVVWTGPNGGDWHTPANWTPLGVPSAADDVLIETAIPVISTGDATVGSIDLRVGLQIEGGRTLTIVGPAPSSWSHGSIAIVDAGTVVNTGQLNIAATLAPTVSLTASGSGPHRFINTGVVESSGPTVAIGAELENHGTLRVVGGTFGQSSPVPSSPDSSGDFIVDAGAVLSLGNVAMDPDSTASGAGTVRFADGRSTVDGSGYAVAGITQIAAGGDLAFNGTGTTRALVFGSFFGTRSGIGTLTVGSGASDLGAAVFEDAGVTAFSSGSQVAIGHEFDVSGHTLRLNGTTNWSFGSLRMFDSGTVENAGTLNIAGDVSVVPASGTGPFVFRNTGGTLNIPVGRTLGTGPALTLDGGVLAGDGSINGSVANAGGTVAPGSSPGTLTILGTYTQGPGGRLHAEIAGAGAHDRLQVNGAATLGGTLELVTAPGFDPAASDTFRVLDAGSRSGTFATVAGAQATPTKRYLPSYDATGVTLAIGVDAANSGPPPPPPAPPPPSPPPPPETGETFNVAAERGKVTVRLPDGRTVTVDETVQIVTGSVVDTREGAVRLSAEGAGGKIETGVFSDGLFRVAQSKGRKPVTQLRLVERLAACTKGGRASTAARRRKRKRRLWGDARGSYRTYGNYGNAINDGTKWLIEDRCDGTFFRVTRGRILVRRNGKRRAVRVRAGDSHLVRRAN